MHIADLLQAAREYRRPKQLHPLVVQAYDAYAAASGRLEPLALDRLNRGLDRLEGGGIAGLTELADALFGLGAFIWYLNEELGDELTAEAVSDVIRSRRDVYAWVAGQIELARQEEHRSRELRQAWLTGRSPGDRLRAPAVGTPAPAQSIAVHVLKPPSKRPPLLRREDTPLERRRPLTRSGSG